jgi:hypothetical protein
MQRIAGQIWSALKKQEQRPLATHVVLEWWLERCSSTTIMWSEATLTDISWTKNLWYKAVRCGVDEEKFRQCRPARRKTSKDSF